MAVVAGIAAVVGAGVQVKGSIDANRARREQRRVSGAQQRIEDTSAQREAARRARIQRAQIESTSESLGVSGSSSEFGAVSSLSTQVNANTARLRGQQAAAEGMSELSQDIADAQVVQQLGGAVKSIGSAAFDKSGGFDNLFKS